MDADPDCTNATPDHLVGHVLDVDHFTRLARYGDVLPGPGVADRVERYWSVQWSLGPDRHDVATVSEPAINLTIERGGVSRAGTRGVGVWITGPVTRGRFDATLHGSGSVVGVKFRLGATLAFADADLAALGDRTIPAREWFPDADDLLDLATDAEGASADLDAWLAAHLREAPVDEARVRGWLQILADPAVVSVAGLAERASVSPRTVQRAFRRFVGVGAKRLIVRARVMDAMAAIDSGAAASGADLAGRVGWFDQAHFIRDFRSVTGHTPDAYARLRAARLRGEEGTPHKVNSGG